MFPTVAACQAIEGCIPHQNIVWKLTTGSIKTTEPVEETTWTSMFWAGELCLINCKTPPKFKMWAEINISEIGPTNSNPDTHVQSPKDTTTLCEPSTVLNLPASTVNLLVGLQSLGPSPPAKKHGACQGGTEFPICFLRLVKFPHFPKAPNSPM